YDPTRVPSARKHALHTHPDQPAYVNWRAQDPPGSNWKKNCDLLLPLAKGEGGPVIFTQFLRTQAALAEHLRAANAAVFVINGQTPAAERQPITERFREQGGALLLTHSGTEGRNLQFSHCLVN